MKIKPFLFASMALGALALGAVAVMAQSGGSAVMKEARVTQVVKEVKILSSAGAPRPATLSDTVRGDTAVRTGPESRAELTFGDLTIARLGANTIFSFNEGSRTVDLGNGAILLRVPKGSGGAKIQTAAVTAAITGTTVIAEYHPKSYAKYLVLEGTMRVYLKGVLGESILLNPGQMLIVNPNAKRLPDPVDFDLERLLKTSLFIQGFRPLPSDPLMAAVQHGQLEKKAAGELIDTNLVIFGRGTLVTLTDPQFTDVVDRKTAAVTLPTPTATAPPPLPTPTATATPTIPPPSPTPTTTGTPTPKPTPNKFGTPPPIVTSVPYPIDNGTTIQTDPAITRAGVTDFGKIYRDAGQDGAFSTWAFTATSPFDTTSGINSLYGPNVPVAAFKFVALQLTGNPTISTAGGGALNLALISVGPITSATSGDATFTFTGLQSVLIATQNGSIDLTSPDLLFQGIPTLIFYARGAGSNLTLGGMGIFGEQTLRLMAENNIQVNAPVQLYTGANGGTLLGTAGGSITVNSPIDAGPLSGPPSGAPMGTGGTVSLSALGGPVTIGSRIQTSYNATGPGSVARSASGGIIRLDSGLTTGTGITLSSTASLLSLLDAAAPGPGGTITLTTAGSDIITNGATIRADRGTIVIETSRSPSVGTAQITLNGGSIRSETLTADTRGGDLTVGTSTPVDLFAVSVALLADRNVTWNGGSLIATATSSPGYVNLGAGNDLVITGAADIERFNGGITDGLDLTVRAGRNVQTADLTLLTDGGGLTNGGNIFLAAGGSYTVTGVARLNTGPTTANQANGSSIQLLAGPVTVGDLVGTVTLGAGRTLTTGGNIMVQATDYTANAAGGGLNLRINNSAPGSIGTGGNISLTLSGNFAAGPDGALNLAVNNQGAQIQTGGNIAAGITGNLTATVINALIDNRFKGFIGNGGTLTFNVNGTLTTSSDANFEILNSQLGTSGGTITAATFIKGTFGDVMVGRDFNVFVDNSDGSIGPSGDDWTVTLQINGTLSVTGRINVFGALTGTGAVTAGELSATNINAPSIAVGSGGITRFSYPNELTINPLHTITTGGLTSTGGINFNGPDVDTPPGFGPFDGGQLTLNVPSLSFGASAADNIQGAVTFNGGSTSSSSIPAGSGGTFTVNATGAITVNSPIEATTGLQPSSSEASGVGGTVNFNSTGGAISVNSTITVSSAEKASAAPPPPVRKSRAGGNINIKSDAPTGVAINVSNTGQLLSLLDAAAPGPGGKITILATGSNSRINVTGQTAAGGGAPPDSIRADKGSVDIRHTGDGGAIFLTDPNIAADIVKVGALGSSGTLSIGGGRINADTMLKLYAVGSNGSVMFISDVLLSGNSMKIIAGNSVTVNNNVVVSVANAPADVYVLDPSKANYSNFNGGNNSTSGKFIIDGTAGSPVSGANTHLGVAPPAFGPPGTP
jgi:quercetin dioxygenase-like cupin family protein